MPRDFTESVVEDAALAWLESLGWTVRHGPEIAPGELSAERASYGEVMLAGRLRAETAVTVKWIAERLQMGAPGYVNHLLYRRRKADRDGRSI